MTSAPEQHQYLSHLKAVISSVMRTQAERDVAKAHKKLSSAQKQLHAEEELLAAAVLKHTEAKEAAAEALALVDETQKRLQAAQRQLRQAQTAVRISSLQREARVG